MKAIDLTALLIIIGGLNWGLLGLFDFDLVPLCTAPARPSHASPSFFVGVSAL